MANKIFNRDNIRALLKLSKEERRRLKGAEKERVYQEALRQYPDIKHLSRTQAVKYKEAIGAYPDLKEMGSAKLILLAYDFRQEQIRVYSGNHNTELADARCNMQLGGYRQENIPKDLPALFFEKECVVCWQNMKGISICPVCWQLLRKCLDLKGAEHSREGWAGWGKDWSLDISNLIRLLKKEGGKTFEEILMQIRNNNDPNGI